MQALLLPDQAQEAYDGLAPHYDAFTAGHDYERWLEVLEGLAAENGLRGDRLLDVGCGTGKSFLPMVERGYEVVACDLSPEMVARAREKVPGGEAEVLVADMRDLPQLGAFDLITCLDDAVNYLTSSADLRAALQGFARNLDDGGLAIFDVNSLATYRTAFGGTAELEHDGALFRLCGETPHDLAPGGLASAWIEVHEPASNGWRQRSRTHHLQRHHPRAEIERAAVDAGLELAAVRGQSTGARIHREPNEELHSKIVYVLRKAA